MKNLTYKKINRRRTIRKLLQKAVPKEVLLKWVDVARLSPSGVNFNLYAMFVEDQKMLKEVVSTLSWAVYLPDYYPSEEDMPQAYIVLLLDKNGLTPVHDVSIDSMSISIVGYDEDLGSCIMTSVAREKLREVLNVPEGLTIELVVAFGYQAENPVIETVKNGDTKYGA